MFGYIYETTNNINGKKYIGKHKSLRFDNNYLGSGNNLRKAINKYGKENFSVRILEEIDTNQEDLDTKEVFWIELYNAVKSKEYYNISYGKEIECWNIDTKGSNNGFYNKHHSEEAKVKISKANKGKSKNKGKISPMKGKHHSEETKAKISKANKGKCYNKGKDNPMYGKHHSEEIKAKISRANKGRKFSEEHIRKLSESHKKYL